MAAYARGLWYHLTNEIIYVELPELPSDFDELEFRSNAPEKDFNIMPNPTDSYFSIILDKELETDHLSYELISLNGQTVKSNQKMNIRNIVSTNDLEAGVYFLYILKNERPVYQEKIIVIK